MTEDREEPAGSEALRRQALERLAARDPAPGPAWSDEDPRVLLHEIQVHQIELEMQNEELLQARAEAEEGLARFTDLYDFAPVGYVTLDPEGRVRQANLKGADILGVDRDHLVGRRLSQFVATVDQPAYVDFLTVAFETREPMSGDFALHGEGPSHCWVRILAVVAADGAECRATLADITEQRNAQDAVRESEERFHQLFDHMHSGVAIYEPVQGGTDFVFVDLNAAGQAQSSVRREDVVGKRVTEVFPGVRDLGLFDVLQRVARSGVPETLPTARYQDGRIELWVENYVFRLPSGQVVALYEDTSELRRAAASLELRDRIATIFLTSPDDDMFDDVLSVILDALDSPLGAFGYLNDDGALVMPTMTREVWAQCQVPGKTYVFPRDTWGDSGWPRALREKETVFSNAVSSMTPKGHVQIGRHVSVPILFGDEAIGLAQVANKASDYSRGDILTLEKIAQYVAPMLNARLQRMRAEEALRHSEQRFKTYIDNAPSGTLVADPTGRFVDANPAACAMTGYSSAELTELRIIDISGEPGERSAHKAFVTLRRTGRFQGEAQVRRKDGTTFPATLDAAVLPDGRFIAFTTDITEREQAAEAIRQSEERYRTLAQNVSIGVALIGRGMEVLMMNRRMQEWFPELQVAAIPTSCRFVHDTPCSTPCATCPTHATLQDGETRERVAQTHSGDRVRHYRIVSTPVRAEDGTVQAAIEMVEDITERVTAEAAQAGLELQLAQSQKMESIGRLAGGVAHDFNNLLTVILNHALLLQEKLGPRDPLREGLGEIHKAGRRASELTRQLLAFSRKQVIEPHVLDLNEILGSSESLLRRIIGEDVDLTFLPDPALAPVDVDPGQMGQVVVNLAVNARDAMPGGGRLTIETSNVVLDELYVSTHPYAKAGRHVLLAVSDTGCGMDADTCAKVFEPFFTTKDVDKGTGLGLSTAYGIVKQSRGSIEVYSEPDVGSTFKIYLPVAERAAEEKAPSPSRSLPRGKETILLIEDEEAVRRVARTILETTGYEILEAGHPHDALRIAKEHAGTIDLILTDVVMPAMSGQECYRHLKELRPTARVLYMSGYTATVMADKGVVDSRVAFIQKPFTVEGLARKVRDTLDAAP